MAVPRGWVVSYEIDANLWLTVFLGKVGSEDALIFLALIFHSMA